MKMKIKVLGKNFYDFDGNKGSNIVIFGENEDSDNKSGISISESPIDFSEHSSITKFPALYSANAQLVSMKNRGGKSITALKFMELEFIEELDLLPVSLEKVDKK